MRHKVKLETLSSVHVGSGDKKVRGIDFLDDENRVYFLNMDKIGNALGVASNPHIATEWSDMAMKGRQEEFFKKKGVDYKKHSRSVFNYVEEFSDKAPSISMQMRDGRGIAYIPGSSIKGAIRTIILLSFLKMRRLEIDISAKMMQKSGVKSFLETSRPIHSDFC